MHEMFCSSLGLFLRDAPFMHESPKTREGTEAQSKRHYLKEADWHVVEVRQKRSRLVNN